MTFPVDGYNPWSMTARVTVWDTDLNIEVKATEPSAYPDDARAGVLAAFNAVKSWAETQYPTAQINTRITYEAYQDEQPPP